MWRILLSLVALVSICGRASAYSECRGVVQSYFTDTAAG